MCILVQSSYELSVIGFKCLVCEEASEASKETLIKKKKELWVPGILSPSRGLEVQTELLPDFSFPSFFSPYPDGINHISYSQNETNADVRKLVFTFKVWTLFKEHETEQTWKMKGLEKRGMSSACRTSWDLISNFFPKMFASIKSVADDLMCPLFKKCFLDIYYAD